MRRKQRNTEKPCVVCGNPTKMQIVTIGYTQNFVCDECFTAYREKHEDDGYMTEADYQTWGRL